MPIRYLRGKIWKLGSPGMVNIAAETILKGTRGPFSRRDDTTTAILNVRSINVEVI